jgi:hypothetical protein
MGPWGSGNFENDHALNYLATIGKPLVQKLVDIVETPSLAEADEDGWVECLVAVELLTTIGLPRIDERLRPELVEACRDTLLAEWIESIDELDPDPDYRAGKLAVIKQSFAKLLAVVKAR